MSPDTTMPTTLRVSGEETWNMSFYGQPRSEGKIEDRHSSKLLRGRGHPLMARSRVDLQMLRWTLLGSVQKSSVLAPTLGLIRTDRSLTEMSGYRARCVSSTHPLQHRAQRCQHSAERLVLRPMAASWT